MEVVKVPVCKKVGCDFERSRRSEAVNTGLFERRFAERLV
jgi:hypothetical protein